MSLALLATLALQTSPFLAATPPAAGVEVGAPLPDVTLPRIEAPGPAGAPPATLSLASLRGKRVLLLQFASW